MGLAEDRKGGSVDRNHDSIQWQFQMAPEHRVSRLPAAGSGVSECMLPAAAAHTPGVAASQEIQDHCADDPVGGVGQGNRRGSGDCGMPHY